MNKTTIAAALCAGLLAGCGEEEPAAPAEVPVESEPSEGGER